MVEVLSFWHAGFHCALPSKQVVQVSASEVHPAWVTLWQDTRTPAVPGAVRTLELRSPHGPLWLSVTNPVFHTLDPRELHGVSAVLRAFLPPRYVVGLAALNDDMVWLVDSERLPGDFSRPGSAPVEAVEAVEESGGARGV